MRIQILKFVAASPRPLQPNDLVTLPDDQARELIEAGSARQYLPLHSERAQATARPRAREKAVR
jgi:hypothetical protein